MKRTALSCLVLCMLASAADAKVRYFGTFLVTDVSQTCIDEQEVLAGALYTARFQPPGLTGNGTATQLSIFSAKSAMALVLPSGSLIGATFQPVNVTGVFSNGGSFTSQMRITAQTPATLVDTTTDIILEGDIEDFAGTTGCTVTFRADTFKQ
jgi:hypothetical protein